MQISYSLHKITDADQFSFCPSSYSKFKYGDDRIAQEFGVLLARGFIDTILSKYSLTKQLVVISSPYSFIPTATYALKNYFVYELNKWLSGNNFPVVQETKIHRTITYKEDYGELNAAERLALIGNDSFHIDKVFLENKTIIFLDDIKITGSHERMILKMIREYDLQCNRFLVYFAELTDMSIHPNIENYLNYYFVKSIFDLKHIIKDERFSINTRIVKYILSADPNLFNVFIQDQSFHFTNLLYNMALGNCYHMIEAYQVNMNFLKEMIRLNDCKNYRPAV